MLSVELDLVDGKTWFVWAKTRASISHSSSPLRSHRGPEFQSRSEYMWRCKHITCMYHVYLWLDSLSLTIPGYEVRASMSKGKGKLTRFGKWLLPCPYYSITQSRLRETSN